MNTAILIPARMAATRLPNKPMADIDGKPMIIRVVEQALKANIADVYVAAGDEIIVDTVKKHGFEAIITDANLPSGSDRIYQALNKIKGYSKYDTIINLQGDLPAIDPKIIKESLTPLKNKSVDIGTLATPINSKEDIMNEAIVKAVVSKNENENIGKALYFTRAPAPWGNGECYYHIGIYAYRYESLEKFMLLPQTPLEKREKLEQLRALENNMRIDVAIVNSAPMSVDTQEDLDNIRQFFLKNKGA